MYHPQPYEMFLAHYDPQLRKTRGVYYTPQPLVSYIVRSVDVLLRSRFGCQDGLADTSTIPYIRKGGHGETLLEDRPRVVMLDPACGTGAFLQGVIDHVRKMYRQSDNSVTWAEYVRDHLLSRLFGFELLIAPYIIAHLNLGMQLTTPDLPERASSGRRKENDKGPGIYLTNTLEEVFQRGEEIFGHAFFEEINESAQVEQDYPVMVVLGNPPYAGHSANKGKWITRLIETYKEGYPELKKPAQAKWLSDDYVKFIRFGQWHIDCVGHGILAFVTNHSYLDNPTFQGMRRSLMQSFDEIYVLDLHGNSKKKERAPDGSKDENVFDIQQGVAIGIFVKWQQSQGHSQTLNQRLAKVHHADLWGLREVYNRDEQRRPVLAGGKYAWLGQHDIGNTPWKELNPQAPLYLFAPQNTQYLAEYESGWKVPDIFGPNGDPAPGIVTTQDEFAISWSRDEAISKVERMLATDSEAEARRLFQLCNQDQWQYSWAKKQLADDHWRQEIVEILYRPFDKRWTVFNRYVAVHRRERVMRHMLAGKNLGITIGRAGQVIDAAQWDIVFCTRDIADYNLYRRGGNNLFPLYLYPIVNADITPVGPDYIPSRPAEAQPSPQGAGWSAGRNTLLADWLRRSLGRSPLFGLPVGTVQGYRPLQPHSLSASGEDASLHTVMPGARRVNLAPEFIAEFSTRLRMRWESDSCDTFDTFDTFDTCQNRGDHKKTFGPEDVLAYMYAIFYSPGYRERYAAFLKVDFPSLPLTSNASFFRALCKLGHKLIGLHLMEQPIPLITGYPICGDNKVEMVRYSDSDESGREGQVWINATQYFEGVPSTAWTFHIGGYQVCQKWLKDRKGRKLSDDDVMHYRRLVSVLAETSLVMQDIDETIQAHGGWPIDGEHL